MGRKAKMAGTKKHEKAAETEVPIQQSQTQANVTEVYALCKHHGLDEWADVVRFICYDQYLEQIDDMLRAAVEQNVRLLKEVVKQGATLEQVDNHTYNELSKFLATINGVPRRYSFCDPCVQQCDDGAASTAGDSGSRDDGAGKFTDSESCGAPC